MASDLTGMFAQLNKAIGQNPLMTGTGDTLMAGASQGLGGGLAGAINTFQPEGKEKVDPYSFMTPDAKKKQATDDLGQLDLQTAEGLAQASKIYSKIGDVEKATALATASSKKKEKQVEALVASGKSIQDEAKRKRGMAIAQSRGDKEGMNAIKGGLITAEDYYKQQLTTDLKTRSTIAGRDPYAGAFTKDVTMNGKVVPVRFRANGEAMAILGEGVNDFELKPIYNPATGGEQMAMISKSNPGQVQFVGEGKAVAPDYKVEEVDGKFYTWVYPPNGGTPGIVNVADTITDAEKAMSQAKATVKTTNLMASIDKGIALIDSDAKVGGWYGPLEYLPATDQRQLNNLLDSIRSNVGFESLRALKEEGGTLGQVSNIENLLLQSEIAKLDSWTDKRDLKKSLEKIRNISERIHMAETTDNPEGLFQAEIGPDGTPTGDRMYRIDATTVAFIAPDGSISIEEAQ